MLINRNGGVYRHNIFWFTKYNYNWNKILWKVHKLRKKCLWAKQWLLFFTETNKAYFVSILQDGKILFVIIQYILVEPVLYVVGWYNNVGACYLTSGRQPLKNIKAHKLTPHVSYTVSKLTNAEWKQSRLITHCPGCELDSNRYPHFHIRKLSHLEYFNPVAF